MPYRSKVIDDLMSSITEKERLNMQRKVKFYSDLLLKIHDTIEARGITQEAAQPESAVSLFLDHELNLGSIENILKLENELDARLISVVEN